MPEKTDPLAPVNTVPKEKATAIPSYKEIQDGDIIPGKTREESQKIYDEQHGQKRPKEM